MDGVDYVIWILPFLAVMDIVSTFYVESYGFFLVYYEAGFFASFFARRGLIYLYAALYVLIMVGIAFMFWSIKNRVLSPASFADKALFVLLVLATCYVYIELTATFISHFFLPHTYFRGLSFVYSLKALVYFGSALSLVFLLYGDVTAWLKGAPRK